LEGFELTTSCILGLNHFCYDQQVRFIDKL
jgi:hypothetical protein